MDNSEEAPLCRFGTPLDPLEEDDVPSKKPVAIEDQIVTDENGKRRFHGAFTGGFSAGFWNTVGSLEGWKPQSFKSSRSEKAEKRQRQLPTDFMDDEDLGEFGIAPQRVQAREDFAKTDESSNRKRKLANKDSGLIPGIPVLQQLLEPSREKVAIRLLRRMGWKPGQGIGARQTRKEKTRSNQRNNRELYVMKNYGCAMNPNDKSVEYASEETSDPSEDEEEDELTFAPDDFEPFVCSIKDNTFGLGYSGLSRQLASDSKSHINLFSPLEVMGKSNQVLSIRGQAFGVGALEEEDEDIYAKDDMSKYDFSLEKKKKREKQKLAGSQVESVLEGFTEASTNSSVQKTLHRVDLKSSFQPRNWTQRKTRFEPLPDETLAVIRQSDAYKKRGLGRHDLGPDERGSILDGVIGKSVEEKEDSKSVSKKKSYLEHITEKYKEREDKSKKMLELLSSRADNFVKGGLITNSGVEIQPIQDDLSEDVKKENQKILSEAKEITKSLGSSSGTFRPFASNEAKQERYKKFIEANLKQEEEIKAFLLTIQPVHLSEWDREMERKEFMQARSIYKPLNGLMFERFVSKSNVIAPTEASKTKQDEKIKVTVKRTKTLWKPCALICKRFNIPEPFGGTLVEPKVPKKNKFSVFDYIENSINSKKDFVTPVIIPKHIEKPKAIQIQKENSESSKERISAKDLLLLDEIMGPSTSTDFSNTTETNASQIRQTSSKDTKKAKTELELRIEESRNKHPSEKKDLFKCIFDSSSDDETQDDDKRDDQNPKDASETTVPADIVQSLVKPSAPINILRHNSPPRGIFAALFSNPVPKEETTETKIDEPPNLDKITFKPKHQRDLMDSDDTYGPKLPTNFVTQSSTTPKDDEIDRKLAELLSAKPVKATKVIEKWVEKSNKSRKKNKKEKKKDHKEKYKHKKSKKKKK